MPQLATPSQLLVTQSSDYSEEESSSVNATAGYTAKLASGVDQQVSSNHKDPHLRTLSSAKATSTLLVTLLGSGMTVEQIYAIYDTGASKSFVKTERECIKGILIQ